MRELILSLVLFSTFLPQLVVAPQKKQTRVAHTSTKAHISERIKKILFASDRLWLLGLDGTLTSIDLKQPKPEIVAPDKLIFDIYRSPTNDLFALGGASKDATLLHVWQQAPTSWTQAAEITKAPKDQVFGLREYRKGLLILTQQRIHVQDEVGRWRSIEIKPALRGVYQASFAATDDGFIYLGVNNGEFGGGIFQLSIDSGQVKKLEKRENSDLCAGPLNSDCDPVTGVIKDPVEPSCVIASIGLRHMMEVGRLIRVCNESVSVVFSKPPEGADKRFAARESEAIFDLVSGEKDYWAVTGRGVYHFTPGEAPIFHAIPKLKTLAGLSFNDEITNVIVVSTDINWAASLSGYTPLLAVKK